MPRGTRSGKGASGPAPAPNGPSPGNPPPGPDGSDSLSDISEHALLEADNFEPWVPPNHPSWTPPDTRVRGHRLPNVELEDPQPNETVGEHLTAWALKHISKNVSAAVRVLAQNYFRIKREMGVRTRPGVDGAEISSSLNLKRGANSDAAFHHLYGNLRSGTDACASCRKGLGPFESCVQISGSCANCRYNSAAKRCSLYVKDGDAKPRGKKRSRKASGGRSRKRTALDDDEDILDAIRSVPRRHLRTLADVLSQVADESEESDSGSE